MKINTLIEFPKKKTLILITFFAFISFLLLTLIMAPTELYLKGKTGYGVIEFEFAWTSQRINTIFKAWGTNGKQKELLVTYVDFLYIPSYAFCYSGLILLITRSLEGRNQRIGLRIMLTPYIAGFFDVIENINLILMLTNEKFINSGSPFIASFCASIKFGFLFLGWMFIIYGLIVIIIKKAKK